MIDFNTLRHEAPFLRQAYGHFPSGVTAVCAMVDGVPTGMAASSFTSVSIDPPLVSVCVQDTSETWPKLQQATRLGLSILAEDQDDVCISLSKKGVDRFANVEWDRTPAGSVFVKGASLWLDCALEIEHRAGDHAIAVLQIAGIHVETEKAPLVFHGSCFRRLAAL